MDRFSAHEETEWDYVAHAVGESARLNGKGIDEHQYPAGSLLAKSFQAGWADADQSEQEGRTCQECGSAGTAITVSFGENVEYRCNNCGSFFMGSASSW